MNSKSRGTLSDIERCVTGKCMGPFCPCLCHTSLKYDHAPITPRRTRSTLKKPRTRGRGRVRLREVAAS